MKTQTSEATEVRYAYQILQSRGAGYFKRQDGRLFLHTGPDALDLLHRLTTNNLLELQQDRAIRTVLTSEIGRVIDVFHVVMLDKEELLLITDADDYTQMQRGILKYTIIEEACLHDLSAQESRITIIGETADTLLTEIDIGFNVNKKNAETGAIVRSAEPHPQVLAIKTDSIGTPAWDIIAKKDVLLDIIATINGLDVPELPIRLFHAIRIQNRIPWPGYELDDRVNPLEAGLMHLIDFNKGCYIGQEVIARLDSYDKVQRTLAAIESTNNDHSAPLMQEGVSIPSPDGGRDIGWITSTAIAPSTNRLVGLAYLRKTHAKQGTQLKDTNGAMFEILSNHDIAI